MKLKIIFFICVSGCMVASSNVQRSQGSYSSLALLEILNAAGRQRLNRLNLNPLTISRPSSPSKPIDPNNSVENQEYVKALEEHSQRQLLFFAQELRGVVGVDPDNVLPRCSRDGLKQALRAKIRNGDMQEKFRSQLSQEMQSYWNGHSQIGRAHV